MSRTRGKTKESVEEEEEEVVVDDGDNEIPDDEGESWRLNFSRWVVVANHLLCTARCYSTTD